MLDTQELEEFLNNNKEYIFDLHLKILTEFKEDLLEEERNPRILSLNGRHRVNCVWAKDSCNEGPDTCECIFFEFRLSRVRDLMSMYYKVFSKMNKQMVK